MVGSSSSVLPHRPCLPRRPRSMVTDGKDLHYLPRHPALRPKPSSDGRPMDGQGGCIGRSTPMATKAPASGRRRSYSAPPPVLLSGKDHVPAAFTDDDSIAEARRSLTPRTAAFVSRPDAVPSLGLPAFAGGQGHRASISDLSCVACRAECGGAPQQTNAQADELGPPLLSFVVIPESPLGVRLGRTMLQAPSQRLRA